MGWATGYIAKLQSGETVEFRPRGNSMSGRISSGQLCTVEPLGGRLPEQGEIVLCRVGRNQYLHIIKAEHQGRFQIGNNHGGINGWIGLDNIYGRCINVRD
jgi:hypothetical protein